MLPKIFENTVNPAFYLSKSERSNEHVLYLASSWSENSQYFTAYTSKNGYQKKSFFKKIGGIIKKFVCFV